MTELRGPFIIAGLIVGLAGPAGAAQQAGDSADARQSARAAQVRFERMRMAHLPWGWSRAGSPRDEIVGRLVLLADGDEEWRPPPDPAPVREARRELLTTLEGAISELPGDGWILGQLIFYYIEAGRAADALMAARSCRAERWWCRALVGYALHAEGRFVASETAFEEALAEMPPEERERWLEIDDLLEGEARAVYRRSGGAERATLRRRFWWLADPLWSAPGNDRRTEHFSRHVLDRILRDSRTPFEMRWGSDLREVLIRYGWPAGWERIRPRTWALGAGGSSSVVGHDAPGERRFAPDAEALAGPSEINFTPGSLEDDGAPTSYAPAYAERFVDLEHQLAVFRRGNAARIVAGWSLPADSLGSSVEVESALAVASGPDGVPALVRKVEPGSSGALVLTVPWRPAVVSIEALARQARLAGRARYGLPLAGPAGRRPALSDLLLVDPAAALPGSLEEAVSRARGTTRTKSGAPLGVFWEFYPPGGGPYDVRLSMRLKDDRGGFWKGLGAALGLTGRKPGAVALEWTESIPAQTTVLPRALLLQLPDLPAGTYVLELEMVLADSRRARVERPIVVE